MSILPFNACYYDLFRLPWGPRQSNVPVLPSLPDRRPLQGGDCDPPSLQWWGGSGKCHQVQDGRQRHELSERWRQVHHNCGPVTHHNYRCGLLFSQGKVHYHNDSFAGSGLLVYQTEKQLESWFYNADTLIFCYNEEGNILLRIALKFYEKYLQYYGHLFPSVVSNTCIELVHDLLKNENLFSGLPFIYFYMSVVVVIFKMVFLLHFKLHTVYLPLFREQSSPLR